jgi:transcriptional regulator with XRE-family HTH domain
MWTFKTGPEFQQQLGERIRARRIGLGLTQRDAALRSGVAYRTWRRLEADGCASIEDLVKAAIALRCEEGLEGLFPAPVAASMDELLKLQSAPVRRRQRASQLQAVDRG